jgi:large subunit ribosomal protein L18
MSRARSPVYTVYFRRRREGKTNYAKRLGLVKSNKTRMVVRKSNKSVTVQFVEYSAGGDVILSSATGAALKKQFKWEPRCNVYTAYLCGLYAAGLAKKKKVSEFVLDLGLQMPTKGSVVFAALKGAVDAGLKTGFSEEMLPADKLGNVPDKYKPQFEDAKKRILAS